MKIDLLLNGFGILFWAIIIWLVYTGYKNRDNNPNRVYLIFVALYDVRRLILCAVVLWFFIMLSLPYFSDSVKLN